MDKLTPEELQYLRQLRAKIDRQDRFMLDFQMALMDLDERDASSQRESGAVIRLVGDDPSQEDLTRHQHLISHGFYLAAASSGDETAMRNALINLPKENRTVVSFDDIHVRVGFVIHNRQIMASVGVARSVGAFEVDALEFIVEDEALTFEGLSLFPMQIIGPVEIIHLPDEEPYIALVLVLGDESRTIEIGLES